MSIMLQTTGCECTEPRDRVYGILSLLNRSDKAIGIEPDCGKTSNEVYRDLVLRYIAHHNIIHTLVPSGLKDKQTEMATWVPDRKVANPVWLFTKGVWSCGSRYLVRIRFDS